MKIIDGICYVSRDRRPGLTGEQLLVSMDENKIDKAVLCCDGRYAAADFCEGNDYIHSLLQEHPDRFYGFATANPWFGTRALREVETRLRQGFHGLFFNPLCQGFMINDSIIEPFMALCEAYAVPVYFRTGTPVSAMPFLVLSLARKFPGVRFIIGQMGANDYIGDAFACVEQAENIYLDCSLNLTVNLRNASRLYADRMIFGSSSPRSLQEFELKKLRQGVTDETALRKILSENLLRILGGKR